MLQKLCNSLRHREDMHVPPLVVQPGHPRGELAFHLQNLVWRKHEIVDGFKTRVPELAAMPNAGQEFGKVIFERGHRSAPPGLHSATQDAYSRRQPESGNSREAT